MGHSSCKTEELIDKADFAVRLTFPLDAMTTADHAHGFKTRQGCGGGFHGLEAARRPDDVLERAMIRLKDVIQVFRGAVYHILRQQPFVLQAQYCLGVRRQLIRRDGGWRMVDSGSSPVWLCAGNDKRRWYSGDRTAWRQSAGLACRSLETSTVGARQLEHRSRRPAMTQIDS
jgi:hypothetical protein